MTVQFSFSGGSQFHPSGLGAWKMTLNENGVMSASWLRLGRETRFGPFQLGKEENERVWGLIEKMHIPLLSSSNRMGVPDEVTYTFTFHLDDKPHKAWGWMNDVKKSPSIYVLVAEINRLIEAYTGNKANLG